MRYSCESVGARNPERSHAAIPTANATARAAKAAVTAAGRTSLRCERAKLALWGMTGRAKLRRACKPFLVVMHASREIDGAIGEIVESHGECDIHIPFSPGDDAQRSRQIRAARQGAGDRDSREGGKLAGNGKAGERGVAIAQACAIVKRDQHRIG